MEARNFIVGHDPIGRRPSIRAELMRLRRDPLEKLLEVIDRDRTDLLSNPRARYQQAYWFYYLSLRRFLSEMSVAARYSGNPKWVLEEP